MMGTLGFEELRVYNLSEELADDIWNIVSRWEAFARSTVGRQLVRATDSIGAIIAEGTGRGTYKDNQHFVKIARGSLYETRHWLRRAYRRKLLKEKEISTLKEIIDELGPKLNAYINSIGRRNSSGDANDK